MEKEKKLKNSTHQFKSYLIYFLLGFTVFLVYFNSLFVPFIRDDIHLVVHNPYIKNFLNFPHYFTQDLFRGKTSNFYRPMQTIFYAIVYHIAGLKPCVFHLLNIILHILNTILIFVLVKRLYGEKIAFFASLFFGIHPLNTEAITYISGTADPLFFMFGLLSIYLFVKKRFVFSYIFFVFSLLSKETGVIFPFFLILYDVTDSGYKKEKIKYYLPFFIFDFIYAVLRMTVLKFSSIKEFIAAPFLQRFYTSFKGLLIYLKLIIFPDILSVERHLPYIKHWYNSWFLPGFILFLFSLFLVFRYRKEKKKIFPYMWFLINFFFISNVFIPLNGNFREHWMYPGIIGILIYFVIFIFKVSGKHFRIVFSILFLLYGVRTVYRNYEWKNPEKFYKKALSHYSFWALHYNLGLQYMDEGKYDKALNELEKSLKIKKHILSYVAIGKVYFLKGDNNKAEEFFKKALQLNPSSATALFNLSLVYIKEGKIEKGKELLLYCISKNPAFQFAYSLLGKIYMEERNYKEAKKYLKIAVEINPDDFKSHHNLGICYGFLGKIDKAEKELKKAVELKPDEISYLRNLAFLLRQENKIDEAIKYYNKILLIKPDSADILNDIGICYAMKGNKEKAIEMWKKAIKINPQLESTIENLKRIENKK